MDLTTGKFVSVFTKYTYIVEEGAFNPDRIYNMDETGTQLYKPVPTLSL